METKIRYALATRIGVLLCSRDIDGVRLGHGTSEIVGLANVNFQFQGDAPPTRRRRTSGRRASEAVPPGAATGMGGPGRAAAGRIEAPPLNITIRLASKPRFPDPSHARISLVRGRSWAWPGSWPWCLTGRGEAPPHSPGRAAAATGRAAAAGRGEAGTG